MKSRLILMLCIILFLFSFVSAQVILLEKEYYLLTDTVVISLNTSEYRDTRLEIISPSRKFSFLNPQSTVRFSPRETGLHQINFFRGISQEDTRGFRVMESSVITTEKDEYRLGERVNIIANHFEPGYMLEVQSPTNLYGYLGVPLEQISFIPREAGEYQLRLVSEEGQLLYSSGFTVSMPQKAGFNVRNSKNQLLEIEMVFIDREGGFRAASTLEKFSLAEEQDIELKLNKDSVKSIRFHNVRNADHMLGFEELPVESVIMEGMTTNAVYAIDPTGVDFDNATVTAVAKGYELFKCKDYDFDAQHCFGTYEKVMDLIPGEEYTFLLTPEDPQYTEQTSQTASCTCTNTCNTGPGASSQCTASCTNYCDVVFDVPPGAVSGWLEIVHYFVTVTLSTDGATSVSASHTGRLDKDEIPSSGNDVLIGSSTVATQATHNVVLRNNDLPDSGATSFDNNACTTWSSGNCTWKPYLSSQFTCQGSRKACTTTISITLINYTWNYTQDTTPPTLVLGNPQNNTFSNRSTNSFFYTPNDNLALSNCSLYLNGALNQTNSTLTKGVQTTFTVSNMADNTYAWYIACFDTSGNLNTSGTRNFYVDTIFPSVSFIWPTPANNTFLSVDYLTVNVSHIETNPDTLSLFWNSNPTRQRYFGSFTNINLSGLSEQTHSYFVRVNDSAGNTNQTGTYFVTVDLTDPAVSLNEPFHNTWYNYNSFIFNYTPLDTNLNNCSLYGNFSGIFWLNQTSTSPVSGSKNSFSQIHLNDGIYAWNVQCFDRAGRSSFAASNYSVLVDATPPFVALQAPANDTYYDMSNTVRFEFSVTDNYEVSNCTLETISAVSTEYYPRSDIIQGAVQNFTVVLANDDYNWTVRCTDQAGNTHFPGYYNLTVFMAEDLVGPTIVQNRPLNNNWTNIDNVVFYYTPTDQSEIHNCSLFINDQYNKTSFDVENAIENNFSVSNFNDGPYSWHIVCFDNSENYNEGLSAAWHFTVDTVMPSTYLFYPDNFFNIISNNINFTWLSIDALSPSMFCELNMNGTVEAGVSTPNNTYRNHTVYFAEEGTYYWNVTCRDQAFNYNITETRIFTVDYTPPQISLQSPTEGFVSTTGNLSFHYTPSDNTSGLHNCSLYIDGMLNQTNYTLFNNQLNNFSISGMRSKHYTWQVNCTDNFGNRGNSTARNFIVDVDPPRTNSFVASPQLAEYGEPVNITVNVTDNFGVDKVIAQVTYPDGSRINYTMGLRTTDIYNFTFTNTLQRGTYTLNIISNDTYSNVNVSMDYYFFVKPGIAVDKIYYDRGETVNITGSGFDPFDNITVSAADPEGIPAIGLPDTILANISGGFVYRWNISTSLGQATGNYTIHVYDTHQPEQFDYDSVYLVRKPKTSFKYDRNTPSGATVIGLVNESDNLRATIVTGGSEDYIDFNWSLIVPPGQVLSDIRFFLEHFESATHNLWIMWWNTSNSQWQDVCTIASSATERIDSCFLNDQIRTSAQANNVRLKVTEKNTLGNPIGTWTNIDFAYLEVRFTTLILDKEVYQQGEKAEITGSRWRVNTHLTLNITRPDGITDQLTVTTDGFGEFNTLYNISYSAPLGTYDLKVFATAAPADYETKNFTVIKRNSSIITDKTHYGRNDALNISGIGFSQAGNISILIYDAMNILRLNTTVLADNTFNGTVQYSWPIPYEYQGYYGLHHVIVRDSLYPNLNGTADITVGIKANLARKSENGIITDVTTLINNSDNISATIVTYNSVEDYILLEFVNTSFSDRVLTNLTFYLRHNETQNYNLALQWFNETSWVDVCSIPYRISRGFDSCDLSPLIARSPRTKNITLKITDLNSNLFTNGQAWTHVDYAYIVSWTEPDNAIPNVTVLLPQPDSVFNHSQAVTLRVWAEDNVQLDGLYAVVRWPGNLETVNLMPVSINYFGDGYYEGVFSSTLDVDFYNITFFVNDTAGNLNNTQKTNFTILSGPFFIDINMSSDNTTVLLNWSAVKTAESYRIFASDDMVSFSMLQAGITGLEWQDNSPGLRRYYRIEGVRGSSYAASPVTAGKHTTQLLSSWNLISMPFNQSNWLLNNGVNNGRDLLTVPGDCLLSLWRYDAAGQAYERTDYVEREWIPATGSESFTSLEHGRGYWAETAESCDLTFYGIVPTEPKEYSLEEYWNIMGQFSSKEQDLGDESIVKVIDVDPENSVSVILRYNTTRNKFDVTVHYPGYGWWPSWNNQDFIRLSPMMGYYFDAEQPAVWTHEPLR
jgi:hypothetical protein